METRVCNCIIYRNFHPRIRDGHLCFGSGRDGQGHGRCCGYFGGRQEFFPTFGP